MDELKQVRPRIVDETLISSPTSPVRPRKVAEPSSPPQEDTPKKTFGQKLTSFVAANKILLIVIAIIVILIIVAIWYGWDSSATPPPAPAPPAPSPQPKKKTEKQVTPKKSELQASLDALKEDDNDDEEEEEATEGEQQAEEPKNE